MIATSIVTLSDSQQAISISGLETAPITIRVRRLSAQQVQNGQLNDVVLSAQAYIVNAAGSEVAGGYQAPPSVMTIHGGTDNYTSILTQLSTKAINEFVTSYSRKLALESLPQDLPLS